MAQAKKPAAGDPAATGAAQAPQIGASGTITVQAKSAQGRWRAALHFTQEPRVLLVEDLGEGDLDELLGDHELIVVDGGELAAGEGG